MNWGRNDAVMVPMNETIQSTSANDHDGEPDYADMSEETFEGFVAQAIEGFADIVEVPRTCIRTFEDSGILAGNRGLVVEIGDAEFQITVVRSR